MTLKRRSTRIERKQKSEFSVESLALAFDSGLKAGGRYHE